MFVFTTQQLTPPYLHSLKSHTSATIHNYLRQPCGPHIALPRLLETNEQNSFTVTAVEAARIQAARAVVQTPRRAASSCLSAIARLLCRNHIMVVVVVVVVSTVLAADGVIIVSDSVDATHIRRGNL